MEERGEWANPVSFGKGIKLQPSLERRDKKREALKWIFEINQDIKLVFILRYLA
jgi:hypothetical protein